MQEETQNSAAVAAGSGAQTPEQAESKFRKIKKILSLKKVWVTALVVAVLVLLAGVAYYYKSLVIAATVNGHPITRVAVIKELEKQGGKDVLDMLVNKQLIANEAKAKGITVSQDEVNQEVKKYEDQFKANGYNLDDTLVAQKMTRDDLKAQIVIQLQMDKLLSDKGNVTDDEVNSYVKDNNVTLPKGQEETVKAQIKDQLKQQKLASASSQLLSDLKAKANIKTYVNY